MNYEWHKQGYLFISRMSTCNAPNYYHHIAITSHGIWCTSSDIYTWSEHPRNAKLTLNIFIFIFLYSIKLSVLLHTILQKSIESLHAVFCIQQRCQRQPSAILKTLVLSGGSQRRVIYICKRQCSVSIVSNIHPSTSRQSPPRASCRTSASISTEAALALGRR